MPDQPLKRCAVYTRKSSEEGLEQDFNSLHAQREACEAFVMSQKSEGWRLVPYTYDDGGISGGTMERPALKRLLGDVEEKRVDIIVVYKVDRLTRSLADFAKMVEVFDKAGASFVAVTQQFNTTTSMGRLTLNVLLSFAQFEREVTGERIRDKIAASKRKGMWMGGNVPLGYLARDRKLHVIPEEAVRIRAIFNRYLQSSGVRELQQDLRERDIRPKNSSGKPNDHFWKGALYTILRNPIYMGMVRHRGEHHPGQHEAIVDARTWEAVQVKLNSQVTRTRSPRRTALSPLKGKIFDEQGRVLTPTHAVKRGRRYRYYVSQPGEQGPSIDDWRLPAAEIEAKVRLIVEEARADAGRIIDAGLKAGIDENELPAVLKAARAADPFELVQSVRLSKDILTVSLRWNCSKPVELECVVPTISPVARSYVDESIDCYVAGHYKASAVMIGAAAEALVLELRDAIRARLSALTLKVPKDLEDWKVKRVLDAVQQVFATRRAELPHGLRDEIESYWPAFTQQIRAVRNDAGHPTNVDPVTAESVQASLLIFPELAALQGRLIAWTSESLS